jgi:GAF domain-containing protein
MEAWRNLRKSVLGRAKDYAELSEDQLGQYRVRLDQQLGRTVRVGMAQHFIAQTARWEAQRVVMLAIERLNADHAQISVLTKDKQITLASTDVAVDAPNTARPAAETWCQNVIGTGDILLIEDGSEHAMVRDTPAAKSGEVVSYLGHPIRVGGEVVGSLCVYSDQARRWTEADVRTLSQLADVAANASQVSVYRPGPA